MGTIDVLGKALENSEAIWRERRASINNPHQEKVARTFTINEAARLIGKSESTIRNLDRRGVISPPQRDHRNHRVYTLDGLDEVRDALGINMGREEGDEVCICAVITYKGGVGKTTTATSLAHYLTMRGKRVLLIDCDPQASCTSLFNYIPDREISLEDTIYRVLVRDEREGHSDYLNPRDMKKIIRDTHWGRLKIVPSSLELYSAEYLLPAEFHADNTGQGGNSMTRRLLDAIETVADDFDVVVLDSPPSIGLISMGIVHAADGLICPMQPSLLDYASAQTFLSMVKEFLERFGGKQLSFLRVLINGYVPHVGTDEVVNMIRDTYGSICMQQVLGRTQEINNATGRLMSLYELDAPLGDRKTHRRGRRMLDGALSEIENLIELTWPSRHDNA